MEQELNSHIQLATKLYDMAVTFLVDYSFQIIGAALIFIIGLFVARWASRATERFCTKHQLDAVLSRFAANGVRILILAGVGIICLGKFGISVAPFVAVIGALSLGAGLALQGVVANYGAGVVIVITRPFTVGDTVTVVGVSGMVYQVRLNCTILDTHDGEKITIPNKKILGEILRNSYANRVWEGKITIASGSNPEKAIELIRKILVQDAAVTKDPEPQIGILSFADTTIVIGYRYWIPTRQYHNTGYRINLAIWSAFRSNGINVPVA